MADNLPEQHHEAAVALHAMGAHIASSKHSHFEGAAEKTDGALETVETGMNSDVTSYLDDIVEFGVDNLTGGLSTLLVVLDEVSTLHPFVGVAVIAFRGILNLVLIKKDNDNRVLAVYAKMCNMMATLRFLRRVPQDHKVDDRSVEDHLQACVKLILLDIQECAKACDSFQAKRTYQRVLNCHMWRNRLKYFIEKFQAHTDTLHEARDTLNTIRIGQTTNKVERTHEKILGMDKKIDAIMDSLMPPAERQLFRDIEDKLGSVEQAMGDEGSRTKLTRLIEEHRTDEDKLVPNAVDVLDDRDEKSPADEEESFKRKLALATRLDADEPASQSDDLSDKIDNDLLAFCKTQPEADDHFPAQVIATRLLDYCMERYIRGGNPPVDPWAARYLITPSPQSFVDALDIDASDSISPCEMSIFFRKRPKNWSLPRWFAYWTIGSSLALKFYYEKIQTLLNEIRELSTKVLPTNRAYVQKLLGEGVFYTCDCLLSGIYTAAEATNWDETLFAEFSEVEDRERNKLHKGLMALAYELDTTGAFDLVVGGSSIQIDKAVLPLLYLILERCKEIIATHACVYPLHRREIFPLRQSLWTLLRACYRRVDTLEGAVLAHGSTDRGLFDKFIATFSSGMYQYVHRYNKLGHAEYIQRGRGIEVFTPGALDGSHPDEPPGTPAIHPLWNYENIKAIVLDQDHRLHAFVQLCVEQGVSAPEKYTAGSFMTMVREALAKVGADDTIGELFEPGPDGKYRQNTLRPRRRLTTLLLPKEWETLNAQYSEEWRHLCCLIVDHIVRRQIVHTPVMCDHCKKRMLNVSRIVCLDCHLDKGQKTIDYCASCLHEDLKFICDAAQSHPTPQSVLSRTFLQLRQFTCDKWIHATLHQARAVIHEHFESHSVYPDITCHRCGHGLKHGGFWFCLDCMRNDARVYVCYNCNFRQEKEIGLWLLRDLIPKTQAQTEASASGTVQGINDPNVVDTSGSDQPLTLQEFEGPGTHHWSHTLVSITLAQHQRSQRTTSPNAAVPRHIKIPRGSAFRFTESPLPFTVSPLSLPSPSLAKGVMRRSSVYFDSPAAAPWLDTIDEHAEDLAADIDKRRSDAPEIGYFQDWIAQSAPVDLGEIDGDEDQTSTMCTEAGIELYVEPPSGPPSPSSTEPDYDAYALLNPPTHTPDHLKTREPEDTTPTGRYPSLGSIPDALPGPPIPVDTLPPGFIPTSVAYRTSLPESPWDLSRRNLLPQRYEPPEYQTPPQAHVPRPRHRADAHRKQTPAQPLGPRQIRGPSNEDLMYEVLSLRERVILAEERSIKRHEDHARKIARHFDDLERRMSSLHRENLTRELDEVRHRMSLYQRDDGWSRNQIRNDVYSERTLRGDDVFEDINARLAFLERRV